MSTLTTTNPIQVTAKFAVELSRQERAQDCKQTFRPPEIQNILVAVDFSNYSAAALRYATFLAENFGATLTLVHSAEPHVSPEDLAAGFTMAEIEARWTMAEKAKLEAIRKTVKEGIPVIVVVTLGTAWNRIVGAAKSWNADLIVIGAHGRTGLKHTIMGSTSERVVRHAGCPVLVVPSPSE